MFAPIWCGKRRLHQLALELGLPEVLRLGEGESKSGGQKRPSILADALEALIGAVYLDAGFETAQALVTRLVKAVDINPQMQAIGKDPKTELQEWLQGRKMKLPIYRVVGTLGAAHEQTFEVECEIDELEFDRTRHWRLAPCGRTSRCCCDVAMYQNCIESKVKIK